MIFEKSKINQNRVWLPAAIKKQLGLQNGDDLYWEETQINGQPVIVVKSEKDFKKSRGPEPTFTGQYPRFLNQ